MNDSFVAPIKLEMRERVEVAIDQAGHELVGAPIAIELPAEAALQGRVKGDLQSLDGEGDRVCYYLRPNSGETLPKWLSNLTAAAHSIHGIQVYVVVEEASPAFEKACRVAGAGLLILDEDNEFDRVIDYRSNLPEALEQEFSETLDRVRRETERKSDQAIAELNDRRSRIGELTSGMDEETKDKYADEVDRLIRIWSEWAFQCSKELDGIASTRSVEELNRIARLVEGGPQLLDLDEE